MAITERIQYVIEVVGQRAASEVKTFTQSLREANGAGGKLQAGINALSGSLTNTLGTGGALGLAGAAVGGYLAAAKKVTDTFAEQALNAGRLADTVGLTVKQADGLLRAFKPLNIEGDDLADILGNINVKAAEGELAKLGIEADNTFDRFRQVIQVLSNVRDETERARIAQKLFEEKGTRQLGSVVAAADEWLARIDEAQKRSLLDEGDVKAANDYKAAMADLNQAVEDLTVTIGPVLAREASQSAAALLAVRDLLQGIAETDLTKVNIGLEDLGGQAFNFVKRVAPFFPQYFGQARDYQRRYDELNTPQVSQTTPVFNRPGTIIDNSRTVIVEPATVSPSRVRDATNRYARRNGSEGVGIR